MKPNTKPLAVAQSALLALIVAVAALAAGRFWTDKPYTNWSKGEANKMLTDSPWARTQTHAQKIPGQGTGISGEKEIFNKFVVRFYSALPVRQAYVRIAELNQKSGKMNEEQKQAFAKEADQMLTAKYPDHIIVSINFESNAREINMDLARYLWNRPKESFKNTIFLITDRKEKIEVLDYFPPSANGTGAKFIFPRQKNGQPIITPNDKEIRVQFLAEQIPNLLFPNLYVTFKVKDMMLNGELVF